MKTKSYVTTLLKFALAFTFAFILLILANVNVEAKTATVTNLKETDIEPYENPDITITWDAVSSGDQTIYYRLETSEDKITWKDEGSYYEPTAKIHAPSGKSVFYARVCAYTAPYDYAYMDDKNLCDIGNWSDTLKVVARISDKTSKIIGTKATAASCPLNGQPFPVHPDIKLYIIQVVFPIFPRNLPQVQIPVRLKT